MLNWVVCLSKVSVKLCFHNYFQGLLCVSVQDKILAIANTSGVRKEEYLQRFQDICASAPSPHTVLTYGSTVQCSSKIKGSQVHLLLQAINVVLLDQCICTVLKVQVNVMGSLHSVPHGESHLLRTDFENLYHSSSSAQSDHTDLPQSL